MILPEKERFNGVVRKTLALHVLPQGSTSMFVFGIRLSIGTTIRSAVLASLYPEGLVQDAKSQILTTADLRLNRLL